jgi:hypothetical protein
MAVLGGQPADGVAAVQIGQFPDSASFTGCGNAPTSSLQKSVVAGNSYIVPPGGGVITSWRAGIVSPPPLSVTLRLFSGNPTGTVFVPVAESKTVTSTTGGATEFATRIPVSGGELLGLRFPSGNPSGCYFVTGMLGDVITQATPQFIGDPENHTSTFASLRLRLAATLEPDQDGDGFGDETQDACPARLGRQDDCVAPVAIIDKGPKKTTKSRRARFAFSSSEAGSSFECALGKRAFRPCSSPTKLRKLKPGKLAFHIRAIDLNDNAGAPVSFRWRVKR